MKKLLFSVPLLVLLFGCASPNAEETVKEASGFYGETVEKISKAENGNQVREVMENFWTRQKTLNRKLQSLPKSQFFRVKSEYRDAIDEGPAKIENTLWEFIDKQSEAKKLPIVLMETDSGDIKIELFAELAPITVKNFLQYVDDKFYDGTIFHRVISDFMIQGGGFLPGMREKSTRETIKNESFNGLTNKRGTLAMARTPLPDSASAQFFINVTGKEFLNKAQAQDGYGYAVFGRVIEGMDVVDKIKDVRTADRSGHEAVPIIDVVIKSARRVEKK